MLLSISIYFLLGFLLWIYLCKVSPPEYKQAMTDSTVGLIVILLWLPLIMLEIIMLLCDEKE